MKRAVISASGIALSGSEQWKKEPGHVSRCGSVKSLVARTLDNRPTVMPSTCAESPRILIADDQPDLIDALRLLLKGQGIETDGVTSPDAAIAALETRPFDLLLMDLNYTGDTTSGREGIDLLSRVQALDHLLPVVVMTGWGNVDIAVEAMRRGVRDFVQKPWDNAHLLATLRSEIEEGRARRRRDASDRRELAEALKIQQRLLPQQVPQIEGCELAA
jgi:DNA-binding NtrC family response regulator